jgi:tetratricopeptide (TPR) repeat protein
MGRLCAVLIVAVGLGTGGWAAAEDAEPASTQARMAELVEALRVALPLSLDPEQFAAEANRARLERALVRLRDGATSLSDHAGGRDVGFAHLASALARDAHEIQHRFQVGRFDEARFLLGELADDCVSCHSRLPYRKSSELGRSLWNAVDASALPLDERVRLQVATRQFDLALQSYESLLASDQLTPAQLDLGGYLSDYLAITIRVRGELARARRQLDAFRKRADVPPYLAELASAWSNALGQLDVPTPSGEEVAHARTVLSAASQLRRFPADRAGLVHDLVASGLLHRAVSAAGRPSADTAEAYYLLGVTELRIGSSQWLTEPEAYLEAAIRAAPASASARRAYVVLEESTLLGYTGSGGEGELPPEVASWLAELRRLATQRP